MTDRAPAVSDPAAGLLAIADELYALPLPGFIPARDVQARALKAEDATLSARVKALRKPSTAAWVVNLLVRFESDRIDQVLSMGAALREAQASMSGDELRALTRQRRQLTAAVTAQARAVAADHGQRVTQAVADQVEATLTAAMVDETCAKAVRSGLLVAALTTTGVDVVELENVVAVPEAIEFVAAPRRPQAAPRPELHVVPDPEAQQKVVAAAEEKLGRVESALVEAGQTLADAVHDVEALEARAMQVQAEIDEIKGRLAVLEEKYEEVDEELGDAEDARVAANDVVVEATRARDAAAAALAKVSS